MSLDMWYSKYQLGNKSCSVRSAGSVLSTLSTLSISHWSRYIEILPRPYTSDRLFVVNSCYLLTPPLVTAQYSLVTAQSSPQPWIVSELSIVPSPSIASTTAIRPSNCNKHCNKQPQSSVVCIPATNSTNPSSAPDPSCPHTVNLKGQS